MNGRAEDHHHFACLKCNVAFMSVVNIFSIQVLKAQALFLRLKNKKYIDGKSIILFVTIFA